MTDNLAGAMAVLGEAMKGIEEAQQRLVGVADGPINGAKETIRLVFAAGFELPELNQAIIMLEECQNDAHGLVPKLAAVSAKIEEVRGG